MVAAPEVASARLVTVRMLVGPCAGQARNVPFETARGLCSGWMPQAELVAVNAAELRETR